MVEIVDDFVDDCKDKERDSENPESQRGAIVSYENAAEEASDRNSWN